MDSARSPLIRSDVLSSRLPYFYCRPKDVLQVVTTAIVLPGYSSNINTVQIPGTSTIYQRIHA